MLDAIGVCRILFALSALAIVYPYMIYPALLQILTKMRRRDWRREPIEPSLSVIVAAHNEERIIEQKIRNCLELDYPTERLEICVVSDGSTDRTDEIVRQFEPRVRLLRQEPRGGKQAALNLAVAQSTGEIVLFTDASVRTRPDLARRVVRSFADKQVGAVSTTIRIVPREGDNPFPPAVKETQSAIANEAEGAYLDLDLKTRRLESFVGSAVGCCGSCYAVRRKCFVPFDHGACNDFASALDAVRLGSRVVFDDEAVGYMLAARNDSGEYRRKMRTIAGGIDTLWRSPLWKQPFRRPIFWWQLMSHKVLRWLGPPLLVFAWFIAIVGGVLGDWWLGIAAILGGVGIIVGVASVVLSRRRRQPLPLRMCKFAVVSVAAAIGAWVAFFAGKRQIVWQPTQR